MNDISIETALLALEEKQISFVYKGRSELLIQKPVSIEHFGESGCISFLRAGSMRSYLSALNETNLLVMKLDQLEYYLDGVNILFTDFPEISFYTIVNLLNTDSNEGIHTSAIISSTAIIGDKVTIGALAYIGPNVILADGVKIGEGCIVNNASIGKNTVLQCSVKIGSPALGGLRDISGKWHDRPHFSRVCVGSNVRIEDSVVINQGYLKDTIISDEVRIGPLSWLGNGVYLAKGVLIGQSVTIAGSVFIGNNSSIWGNASIREGVKIGNGSMVGMGSVVLRDIPDCELWVGSPACFKRKV